MNRKFFSDRFSEFIVVWWTVEKTAGGEDCTVDCFFDAVYERLRQLSKSLTGKIVSAVDYLIND